MELISKSVLLLFLLLFWGGGQTYAHMHNERILNFPVHNHQAAGKSVVATEHNTDVRAFNLTQRTIKKEKAIIEDNDEDEDDEDKVATPKKYCPASKSTGILFFTVTPDAHCVANTKRCFRYSKHLAIASSCRLFIRNRVIRI